MTPRLTLQGLVAFVVAAFVSGTTAERADKKFDVEKLKGEWNYTGGWDSGKEVPKERLHNPVIVDKDTFTVHGEKDVKFVMAYKITDDTREIAPIDLEIKSGPEGSKGVKALGLVWTDGKEMKLAYVVDDGKNKRPADFKAKTEAGVHYFELKKK